MSLCDSIYIPRIRILHFSWTLDVDVLSCSHSKKPNCGSRNHRIRSVSVAGKLSLILPLVSTDSQVKHEVDGCEVAFCFEGTDITLTPKILRMAITTAVVKLPSF